MREVFTIIRMYDVEWTTELVSSNFTRFYGENLPDHSEKEIECGMGRFLLIIVRDEYPKYDYRATSHGMELVNVHMFDKKALYRQWTGGGHKIHSTNSSWEFNHDITLLLGANADDYIRTLDNKDANIDEIIPLSRDIIGARGWKSLEELIYVMNATTTYVVLRGEEWLIGQHEGNDHRDVDILLNRCQSAIYIINGSYYCESLHPHILVDISGRKYIFDFWECNQGVYDILWECKMLENRVLENGYYVLSDNDRFYTLLYHCLINKNTISPDYKLKLEQGKTRLQITKEDWYQILVDFLASNNYVVPIENNLGITIHLDNAIIHSYAYKYGKLIKRLCEEIEGKKYISSVYEKTKSFVKKGSPILIDNETRFLHQLKLYSFSPKVLSSGDDGRERWIEISRILGVSVDKFFIINHKHNTAHNIKIFIQKVIEILVVLRNEDVVHRDFIPANILISDTEGVISNVSLIDFGWAIYRGEANECLTPTMLGANYSSHDKLSDSYSFSIILKECWPRINAVRQVVSQLQQGVKLEDVLIRFSLRDYFRLYLMRHKNINNHISPILKKTKQMLKKILR